MARRGPLGQFSIYVIVVVKNLLVKNILVKNILVKNILVKNLLVKNLLVNESIKTLVESFYVCISLRELAFIMCNA